MKKIFLVLVALFVFPFALIYGLPRYIYYNKGNFWKLVEMRRNMRAEKVYQANYQYFQKELAKDEN